jgi:hypothetical protein
MRGQGALIARGVGPMCAGRLLLIATLRDTDPRQGLDRPRRVHEPEPGVVLRRDALHSPP